MYPFANYQSEKMTVSETINQYSGCFTTTRDKIHLLQSYYSCSKKYSTRQVENKTCSQRYYQTKKI